jgi:aryl-alcohol dehydrogenase-like predicted oxidoreductase
MHPVENRLALSTAHFRRPGALTPARARQFDTELRGAFELAADAGMTLVDISAEGTETEALVGRLAPRDRPFRPIAKTAPLHGGIAAVVARARRSLRNLGTTCGYAIVVSEAEDLLGPEGDELWRALTDLRDTGLFEKIGVSARIEDAPAALARRFRPDIMQLPVSLLDQRLVSGGELQTLAELGVEVHLRSIFLQGLMFLPSDGLPPELAEAGPRLSRIRREIAEAGADPLQAALAFALRQTDASHVVVGVASEAELRAILAAAAAPAPQLDWAALGLNAHEAEHVGLWAAA